jgi:hypothetical protein
MATDGQNSKPYTVETLQETIKKREAKKARHKNSSLAQRKNWARFRAGGAAGFAEGAVASAINRLQALRSEIPAGMVTGHDAISADIQQLIAIHKRIRTHRMTVQDLIDEAEVM